MEKRLSGYTPRTTKTLTPQTVALFSGKSEKIMGSDRTIKRDKFRQELKNKMVKK